MFYLLKCNKYPSKVLLKPPEELYIVFLCLQVKRAAQCVYMIL